MLIDGVLQIEQTEEAADSQEIDEENYVMESIIQREAKGLFPMLFNYALLGLDDVKDRLFLSEEEEIMVRFERIWINWHVSR